MVWLAVLEVEADYGVLAQPSSVGRRQSMRVVLVLLATFVLGGCDDRKVETEPPTYTLVIPDDVPEMVVLIDKDGTKRKGNGRALYSRGHEQGWRDCWQGYRKGWVHLDDDLDWQRFVPQDDIPAQQGFEQGFVQCQQRLRESSASAGVKRGNP
jgi:hypothetical protein